MRLKSLGYNVERREGADRFSTAVSVAKEVASKTGGTPKRIYVATGMVYADPVVGAPAAAHAGGVVEFTAGDHLPEVTERYLRAHSSVPRVAVGGPAARALRSAGLPAAELTGTDRYEVAAKVAGDSFPEATTAFIANGVAYSDIVVAGTLASLGDSPVLLSWAEYLPAKTKQYSEQGASRNIHTYLIGGPGVISTQVENDIRLLESR